YKEDFNKFLKALTEAVDYVKTDLMPDFDFDAYNHDNEGENQGGYVENTVVDEVEDDVKEPKHTNVAPSAPTATGEEVDKW
ncbi:MAG TPA: DNA-binding protein, partial [Puia sp.]|nr:DNA-binding protein [Puia sp.]